MRIVNVYHTGHYASSLPLDPAEVIVYDLETIHDSERGNYAEKGSEAAKKQLVVFGMKSECL